MLYYFNNYGLYYLVHLIAVNFAVLNVVYNILYIVANELL